MEKLIFSNKYTKKEYSFSEHINQLDDRNLIKILCKENYRNEDSGLFVTSSNNIPVSDLFQIKINIVGAGTFLVNFTPDTLDETKKKELIDNVSKLKTEGEIPDEEQFKKIKNLISILVEYKPLFLTFTNNQEFNIEKANFLNLTSDLNLTTYILILSKPKPIKIKLKKTDKNNPEQKCVIEVISFRDYIADNIFFGLFCLNMSFSLMLGMIMSFNTDALSIPLFVLTAIIFAIYSYSIFKYIDDFKKWTFDYQKIKFPALLSAIGIVCGIGIGFLYGFFAVKPTEGHSINYGLSLGISIPVSIFLTLLGMATGYLIFVINKKAKEKQK